MLKVSSCLTSPSRNPSCNFKGNKKKETKNRKKKPKHNMQYIIVIFLALKKDKYKVIA